MTRKSSRKRRRSTRRSYSDELKAEAVQMLLDGHSAESVAREMLLGGWPARWPLLFPVCPRTTGRLPALWHRS